MKYFELVLHKYKYMPVHCKGKLSFTDLISNRVCCLRFCKSNVQFLGNSEMLDPAMEILWNDSSSSQSYWNSEKYYLLGYKAMYFV
jgi:hypothetical protein